MKKNYLLAGAMFFSLATIFAQGDNCGVAVAVTPGAFTADGPSTGGGSVNATNADWYSYTPATNGTMDISACLGGADTRLYVYDGTCGTLNQIATNDDVCDMGTGNNWASELLLIPVTGGTTYYIEWDDNWDTNGFQWTLSFAGAATCPQPTSLTVTSVTNTSTNLDWTEAGTATTWDVEWGANGFVQGAGTMVTGTTTNPHNLTGLTAQTTYDFYVRADCGGAAGTSLWSGPFSFTTACNAMTLPYSEGFEDPANLACWSLANSSANFSWFTLTGPTSSTSTGPDGASIPAVATDTVYIYTEASSPAAAGDASRLQSPMIDLSGFINNQLTFDYHMYGADIVSLITQVDDGTGFVDVDTIIGQQQTATGDNWMNRNIDLSAYSGVIQVGFLVVRGASFNGDVAVDDVAISGTVGIGENSENINLTVYPNPNKGLFTLNVNTTDVNELDVKVMNIHGQVVFAKNNFDNVSNVNEQIDLSNNAKGIYFVTVTSDKGVITHKMIVQ